jgi:hypothetical protein
VVGNGQHLAGRGRVIGAHEAAQVQATDAVLRADFGGPELAFLDIALNRLAVDIQLPGDFIHGQPFSSHE